MMLHFNKTEDIDEWSKLKNKYLEEVDKTILSEKKEGKEIEKEGVKNLVSYPLDDYEKYFKNKTNAWGYTYNINVEGEYLRRLCEDYGIKKEEFL